MHACYLLGSVDINHRLKHTTKTNDAINVTGDAKVDPLYVDSRIERASEEFDNYNWDNVEF